MHIQSIKIDEFFQKICTDHNPFYDIHIFLVGLYKSNVH